MPANFPLEIWGQMGFLMATEGVWYPAEMRKGKRVKLQRRSDKITALAKKIGKAWRWSVEVKNKKKQLKCQYQAYSNAVNAQGEQERLREAVIYVLAEFVR